jgi:hypothetical protein
MFSPTRTALCIAVCAAMGLAANEASAGCKIISGTKVCATWITGSEICEVWNNGLYSTAQCIVHGVGAFVGGKFTCDDSRLNGAQTCITVPNIGSSAKGGTRDGGSGGNNDGGSGGNNKGPRPSCSNRSNSGGGDDEGGNQGNNPPTNPSCVQGTPNLAGGELESPVVPLTCNTVTGICTGAAEVGVPNGAMCSNGQTLLDFTAGEFIGIVEFFGEGVVDLYQHCTLNQQCGPGLGSYTCTDITNQIDPSNCFGGE